MPVTKQQALDYHCWPRPGKIEVIPTKPCRTQRDLSLAYTPGVAELLPGNRKESARCLSSTPRAETWSPSSPTARPSSVSANIGALAGKPVMEGKGVLFKRFADVDVFDLEVNTPRSRRNHQGLPTAGAHLRRHQPRRHQGARMLLHRRDAQEDHADSRLPRRPARHGHHFRRGAAERAGNCRQKHRRSPSGLQRSGRGRHCLRRALCSPGREAREHHAVRHQRRDLQRSHRRA